MRKVLVAILCLFFLGACSRGYEEEQAKVPENELGLAVRSGDVVTSVSMPAWVYKLTGLAPGVAFEQKYFAAEEKISFQDLLPGEYTFFILGNERKDSDVTFSVVDKELKIIRLEWWRSDTIPELFGGIAKVNGSNESETVEMTRLVGGVTVNVTNKDEYSRVFVDLVMPYTERDTIWVNDYAILPRFSSYDIEEGALAYRFPGSIPVRGEIRAYDESEQEYLFEFQSTKCIERNKKLELNVTLERASSLARSGKAKNTVTCAEKVSDL